MKKLFQSTQALIRFSILVLLCLTAFLTNASANSYVVDNVSDTDNGLGYSIGDGNNSLRKCIRLANAHSGADDITFSTSGTIVSTSTLSVTDPLTINGETATGWASGTPTIRVDGNNSTVLDVLQFNTGSGASTLKSVVLTRGRYGLSISGTLVYKVR